MLYIHFFSFQNQIIKRLDVIKKKKKTKYMIIIKHVFIWFHLSTWNYTLKFNDIKVYKL